MIDALSGNSRLLETGAPAAPAKSPVSAGVSDVLAGHEPRCDSHTLFHALEHHQDPIFSALVRQYLNRRHDDQADPEAGQDYTHNQTSAKGCELHRRVDGAISVAVAYGLTHPVAFTLRLGDDQSHDNSLKSLKTAVQCVLEEAGEAPLVWVFVKVPATQTEGAHLHGVVFLPPGPAPQAHFPKTGRALTLDEVARPRQWLPPQLEAWAERRNAGKPGAVKFKPVYDLWGAVGYMGCQRNLGRRGATSHASQAAKNPAGHMPALNHNGLPLNDPAANRSFADEGASPTEPGPARLRRASPQAQPPPSDVQALQVQAEVDLA